MRLKQPKLHIATDLPTNAFDVSQSIQSEYNVNYITRLYNDLRESSYGNSTAVADLGIAIKDWRKTQGKLR